jgi:hypothetical protein
LTLIDVYGKIKQLNDDVRLKNMINMPLYQFDFILDSLKHAGFHKQIAHCACKLSFENKTLLLFIWIIEYPSFGILATMFQCSSAVISTLIKNALPYLVDFFVGFIPNSVESAVTSCLSESIIAVVDGTVHKIRRPSIDQHRTFNGHYQMHCTSSILPVDFDSTIVSVATNFDGSVLDCVALKHCNMLQQVLVDKFAIGDPGFAGSENVISGLKSNQVKSVGQIMFDRISRQEQVCIEAVNGFIKKCVSISKTHQFTHSRWHLTCCVFICCGLYNFMKKNFGKYTAEHFGS